MSALPAERFITRTPRWWWAVSLNMNIAFPVIEKTLLHYFRDRKKGTFEFLSLELAEPPGVIREQDEKQ
jgi:hypothetical protein